MASTRRLADRKGGLIALTNMTITVPAGTLILDTRLLPPRHTTHAHTGQVWSPAPAEGWTRRFPAADHEVVWALLDDGSLWHLVIRVADGVAVMGKHYADDMAPRIETKPEPITPSEAEMFDAWAAEFAIEEQETMAAFDSIHLESTPDPELVTIAAAPAATGLSAKPRRATTRPAPPTRPTISPVVILERTAPDPAPARSRIRAKLNDPTWRRTIAARILRTTADIIDPD